MLSLRITVAAGRKLALRPAFALTPPGSVSTLPNQIRPSRGGRPAAPRATPEDPDMATVQPIVEDRGSFVQREYSPAAKRALARKPALFINNEWVSSTHGATLIVEDPSTGREVGRIADASDADVDRAVAAARAAFDDGRWSNLPPKARDRTINKLADLI